MNSAMQLAELEEAEVGVEVEVEVECTAKCASLYTSWCSADLFCHWRVGRSVGRSLSFVRFLSLLLIRWRFGRRGLLITRELQGRSM